MKQIQFKFLWWKFSIPIYYVNEITLDFEDLVPEKEVILIN